MATQKDVEKAIVSGDSKVVTVYDFFEKQRDLIAKALPEIITPDRMIALFTMVIKSSPGLLGCSQMSLISALIQTIQLGLLPGPTDLVYYVPFNNKQKNGGFQKEVQFILGYKGTIELINRSGKAAILSAECVHKKDKFHYALGLEPKLEHEPAEGDRGEIIGVYARGKNMIVNEKIFVYLHKSEIEKVRSASKTGQSSYSPWNKWYEQMAKKTAIKRLAKLLPLSIDVQKFLSTDETIKAEISEDMTQVPDTTNWEEEPTDITPEKPAPEAPPKANNEQHPPDQEATSDDQKRSDISTELLTRAKGNKEIAADLLEELTAFTGKEGNQVKGLRDCNYLKGVRMQIAYKKIFPVKKNDKPEADEIPEPVRGDNPPF